MSSDQEAAVVDQTVTGHACATIEAIGTEVKPGYIAGQTLLCTDFHEKVDDTGLFEHLDSESILPSIQDTSRPNPTDKPPVPVAVVDNEDTKCHTTYYNVSPVPQKEDEKCKHALMSISETDPAMAHGNLTLDSGTKNKQTSVENKGTEGWGNVDIQPAQGCSAEEDEEMEADLVTAAVAVEKALEGSELGLERMQEADIEKKSNFGNAESLRFQNSMFEVIEELRIRKTMDVENEMKMKQFMKEKQLLENKHEDAMACNETLRTMQKEQVAAVKKQFEARMSRLRNENARYATKCDATDKETKLLKDEIRAFQLSKYTLEKRLREMEQKLQLQTTIKDSHLSRLAELDTLADAVNKRVTELSLQQGRLERNVVEAEKLTRKLNYLNAHQTCLIDGYKSELAQLQQDLVKAKVKLDQQPANLHNEQLEIQHKMKVLEDALISQKDSVAFLARQLDEKRSEHEKTLDLLAAAHSLVEQQVTLNNHSSKVAKKHCATIEELTTQLTSMKADYDVKCKQLDIETQSHENTVSDWKTQQQSVFHQLKTLQHEHQVLMKHHTALEDLNTHWAKKNVALIEEVKLLEDQLNKPKCDVALQTEVEVTDVALQTEMEVTDVALQTEVEVTDVTFQIELDVTETSVQTQEVRMGDTATQTDTLTSDMKSSQTEHVASVHQFVQTEDYKKEDNEEGRKDESNSSMQPEPAPVPSTSSATRLDSTDYSTDRPSHEAVHEHSINVTVLCEDQKNSQQLEVDKCSNEIQRPVDTIPVLPTGTISDTATLKPLGHSRKDAIVTQKVVEVDTKRRRLTEAQPEKSGTTSHRYTFQFIDFPEPTVAPPVAQLPSIRPKGPQSSRTKSPVGILHDSKVQRQGSMKRVTFKRYRDTRPAGGSTDTWRTAGSFDQLQKHWENIHGAFDDMSTVVGSHPPGTSLKSEACFDDNDDTVLFSDDEPAGFGIGSQVERIEHFLLSDRLELGKSHSSKLQ